MENKKTYCILCGQENNATSKFCISCGESLNQKDDDLFVRAKEKAVGDIKDKIKGKAEESFLALLEKFVNSYLYGAVLSVTIVASAVNIFGGVKSDVTEFNNSNSPFSKYDAEMYDGNFWPEEEIMDLSDDSCYMVKRDNNGNITEGYVHLYALDYGDDATITITDASGKVVADTDDAIKGYDLPPNSAYSLFKLPDFNVTVTITENISTGAQKTVSTFHPNGAVKDHMDYRNDVLFIRTLYNESNVKTADYYYETEEDMRRCAYKEYNAAGDYVLSIIYENDIPVRKDVVDYGDNYEYTYIYYYDENGNEVPQDYYIKEFNDAGLVVRSGWIHPDNTVDTMGITSYYDSGAVKTREHYSGEKLTQIDEYEEDGSGTSHRYMYYDGVKTLYESTIYDTNGRMAERKIYATDGRSITREIRHYPDGSGEEIHYDTDGSIVKHDKWSAPETN